jgi:N4-gp56 family major capsid protein
MATATYGSLSQRTAAYAMVEALSHAEPIIVLGKFGMNKPIPKNKALTVKFRRANPYGANVTPLTEGVAPTARAITYTDVSLTLAQFGDVAALTDVVAGHRRRPRPQGHDAARWRAGCGVGRGSDVGRAAGRHERDLRERRQRAPW